MFLFSASLCDKFAETCFPEKVFHPTPKAFANFSPGLEPERQPWENGPEMRFNSERVRQLPNTFSVFDS
jgi:hypothetical protein